MYLEKLLVVFSIALVIFSGVVFAENDTVPDQGVDSPGIGIGSSDESPDDDTDVVEDSEPDEIPENVGDSSDGLTDEDDEEPIEEIDDDVLMPDHDDTDNQEDYDNDGNETVDPPEKSETSEVMQLDSSDSTSSSSSSSSDAYYACTNPVVLVPPSSCSYIVEGDEDIYISYESWTDEGNIVIALNGVSYTKDVGSTIDVGGTTVIVQEIDYDDMVDEYPVATISFEERMVEEAVESVSDVSGKRIIVWSVDVGAWWSVDNAIHVTDLIRGKDVPVTVGVIPITGGGLYELGGDSSLVEYLREIRDDGDVEIAIQGLKFEDNEFYGKTSEDVRDKILQGKSIISGAVYVEPVTFMPPYFVYDENALIGAHDAGISYFSAGWNAIDSGDAFTEYPAGLMNVPVTTDSYNWGAGDFYSADEIEEMCMNAMDSFGTCAIIFQHDMFTDSSGNIDSGKIQVLSDVMDWVKEMESDGAILQTVGEHSIVDEPPVTEPDPDPEPEPEPDPEPVPEVEKGMIVFRSDDFSAYWSVENAITVSEAIRGMDVPQVLSVIPSSAYGYDMTDDARLLEYLREIRSSGDAEIALHGYNHALNEFEDLSALSTYYKMKYATEIYNEAFGEMPSSFVPPYNLYNSLTSFYADANGMSVMSAGSTDLSDGSAFKVDRYGLLHLPQTTDIYSWANGALYTEEEIETSCQQALDKYGACVIVIHHHVLTGADGSIDPEKLSLIENLVEWAKGKESRGEIEISTFEDVDAERFS